MLSIKHNTRTDSSDNNHKSSSEPVFGKSSIKVVINLKVYEWGIIVSRVCGNSINMLRVYVIKEPIVERLLGGDTRGPWSGAD